jgi:hypothetical protein
VTLRLPLVALALAAPLAAPAAPDTRVRVVVMDLDPSTPDLKSAAGVLTGVVLDELGRSSAVAAMGSSEIATLIGLERQKTLLGCDVNGSECLTEIGNALGAKYVLRGTIGALGKSLRLDLTLLDTSGVALAREGGTAARVEDLEAEARGAARRLAVAAHLPPGKAPVAVAPGPGVAPAIDPGPWPWVLTGGGAALLAAGGVGIGYGWSVQAAFDAQQFGGTDVASPTVGRSDAERAATLYPVAIGSAIAGAAAVAAGVWWLLAPPSKPGQPKLVPAPGGAAIRIDL